MRAKPSDDMDGTEDTPAPRVKARHSVMASNPALEVYRSAWTARYRVPCPARGPRFMREANEILEKCGSEESFRGAVERFFGCTERYVVEHKHELWLLNRNLSRYVAAHTHREGVERLRVL